MKFNFLKAQPARPVTLSGQKLDEKYRYWRIRMMYSMFIGYAVFYFTRKNLSASTPALLNDLHLTKTQIGWVWSALYLSYGVSKLVNGVLGDRANARYFMSIGLFLSAICNIAFGLSSSLTTLGIFWALNGWFQGMGWPASARLLSYWYSPNERGTKWAIWNTAHQIGGGLILILAGYLSEHYGWRSSFFLPAFIAVATCAFLVNRLRDTPESLGLPEIEDYRKDDTAIRYPKSHFKQNRVKDILFNHVLCNREIWFLSFGNFFVYLVRYGAMDWAPTFLHEVKHSSIAAASTKAAFFEFLGIGGALLAGHLSDTKFKGQRSWVNVIYMTLLAFAVVEFWLIPPGHPYLDALALGAVGFLVYGPQMLVGVCAADTASKHAAATATGFTGLFGYLGSILSGIGTGWIVDHYGWSGGFAFFTAASLLGAVCLIPFWSRKRIPKHA